MPRSRHSKSHTRSRSRSRSHSRNYRNSDRDSDRGGRNNSYRRDEDDGDRNEHSDADLCRLHIADLTDQVSKSEIEKVFGKYGDLEEVWMAKNPPCFAFVVFKTKDDAGEALKEMDGRTLGGRRIRVTQALPRVRGGRKKRWDADTRCYQCGKRGHFSRDCRYESQDNRRRRYSRSASRDRDRRGSYRGRSPRSYSRSRSPAKGSKNDKRSRTRSVSKVRRDRSVSPARNDYRSGNNGSANGEAIVD